jgi:glycine betaine/proline transport system substrate-binding protein
MMFGSPGEAIMRPARSCAGRNQWEKIMLRLKPLVVSLALAASLASGAAYAGDSASCQTVRFADVGWTDIQATTATASVILDAIGYKPDTQVLSVPVTYTSLKNKDIDVFLGNWMPSMTGDVKPYLDDKSVESISENLEGAGYGLVVPNYVADAGVKSLSDLSSHADKFDKKIYGIEPGNDGNRIVLGMIKDPKNHLDGWDLVESSEAGMLSQAEKSMANKDWIVFLGWTPHPVMGEMKITYLDGMGDSGFGSATVHTNVRAGYLNECPNVGKFIKQLKFDLSMENKMMDGILKGGDAHKVAADWLKAHPGAADKWLDGVTTFDGKDAKEALKAKLGS